ncbi:hypothetical protein [Dissulfurispira sp.]|uniref:hypothetical protein n=1 Tax=Dissulfurispira sp. TaxID=2817609 RepID=UPI002FD93D80
MNKKFLNFFYFVLTVAILIAALKIFNYLPMMIQKDTMRRYHSIEDVKSNLNIREILIPYYFPQSFVWPPSEIFAQKKPFTAVVMEFKHARSGDVALIISQAGSKNFKADEKIKMVQIKEKISYPLKGRTVALEAGMCKNEEPCSRISWDEDKYRMTVTAKTSPPELLKIAESMIR